jgi:phage gp36-like protein
VTPYLSLAEFRARTIMPSANVDELEALAYGAITNTATTGTVIGATNATPIVVQASAPDGLNVNDQVTVAGVIGNTKANGTWPAAPVDASHFALSGSAGNGVYGGGGTFSALGSSTISPSPSPPSGTFPIVVRFTAGGVVGTPGITWQFSVDGGVTYNGVDLALGSSRSIVVPNTGAAFLLGDGSIVGGQKFSCTVQSPFVEAELNDWTAYVEARLRKRYAIPFVAPIPSCVKKWLCDIVTKRAYDKLGRNPTSAQDSKAIDEPYDQAIAEIKEAADSNTGLFDLPLRDDAAGSGVSAGGPLGYTETSAYAWTDIEAEAGRAEDRARMGSGDG